MKYFSWFCFQIVWRTDYTFSMPPCLSFVRNIFASGRQATLVTDSCPPCGCRVQATRSFGTRFLWSISQKLVNPNMTRESIYVYIYNQNISMIYYIYSNVCIYICISTNHKPFDLQCIRNMVGRFIYHRTTLILLPSTIRFSIRGEYFLTIYPWTSTITFH
jgi:hypothetical protein